MANIIIPQKKDDTNELLQIGGLAAGAIFPGALGATSALGGAVAGAGAANLGSGLLNPPKAAPASVTSNAPSGTNPNVSSTAISRRLEALQASPVQQLSEAQAALKVQPPNVQKQYMDTINQALILAQRDQRRGQA